MDSHNRNNEIETFEKVFGSKSPGKKPNIRGLKFPLSFLSFPELGYSKDFYDMLISILYYHIYFNVSPGFQSQEGSKLIQDIYELKFTEYQDDGYFQDMRNQQPNETLATVKACLLIYPKIRLIKELETIAKKAKQHLERQTALRGEPAYVSMEIGNFIKYLNKPDIKNEELFRIYSGLKAKIGTPKNGVKSDYKRISKEIIYSLARGSSSKKDLEIIEAHSIGTPFKISEKKLRNRLKTITEVTDIKSYSLRNITYYCTNRSQTEVDEDYKEALQKFQPKKSFQEPHPQPQIIKFVRDELPF